MQLWRSVALEAWAIPAAAASPPPVDLMTMGALGGRQATPVMAFRAREAPLPVPLAMVVGEFVASVAPPVAAPAESEWKVPAVCRMAPAFAALVLVQPAARGPV